MLKILRDKGGIIDSRYICRRFNGFKLTVWKCLCEDAFVELCCRISERKNAPCTRVLSSAFARVHRFKFGNKIYYHKAFLPRSRWEPIKDVFKGTRAERTLRGHLLLEKNGFGTPRVVAVGKKGPSNFMISEAMTGDRSGRSYWQDSFPAKSGETFKPKRHLIQSLGGTVGKLHASGIFHGDLRLNNIGINGRETGPWQFEFIDNERTVQFRRLPDDRRIKNLVQRCMSTTRLTTRTDRLRFFYAYFAENPEMVGRKKQWIRRVLMHLSERLEKKRVKKASGTGKCTG